MVAFSTHAPEPSRGGFCTSMAGTEQDDVTEFAERLQHPDVPLDIDGREAFRMANAQATHLKHDTMRIAIQVAMRGLAMAAMRRLEARQAMAD